MADRPEKPRAEEARPVSETASPARGSSNKQAKRTREERLLHLYATRPLAVAERAMKALYGRQQRRGFSGGRDGGGGGGRGGPGGRPGGGPGGGGPGGAPTGGGASKG